MKHKKRSLGLIGLCMALGLMAFASSAQAGWVILNAAGTTETELLATISASADTVQKLAVSGLLTLLCTEEEAIGGELLAVPVGGSKGKLRYKNCRVFNAADTAELTACSARGSTDAVGSKQITTNALKDQLFLHTDGKTNDRFEPESAEAEAPFVEVVVEGAECAVKGTYPVRGKVIVQDCPPNTLETYLVKHLVEPVVGSSLFPENKLTFGIKAATLSGSTWVELSGAHLGLKFKGKI